MSRNRFELSTAANAERSLEPMTTQLPGLARRIRLHAVRMTHRGEGCHVASSLSMADLLAVLYGKVLRVRPEAPDDPDRDRFILSKGHACAGLYAVLAESGFFPVTWLDSFYVDGAKLPGHATAGHIPGIEVSTGSLGHGLPIACGVALAGHLDARPYRVFAVLSDGECDEGSTWEAAMFAGHHGLDNLIAIVDYNNIQGIGFLKEVMDLEPFAAKWASCRWAVREIDGHDCNAIGQTLGQLPFEQGKPSCVIAHTVKGKGVSFMENTVLWHYRIPQGREYEAAIAELEAQA